MSYFTTTEDISVQLKIVVVVAVAPVSFVTKTNIKDSQSTLRITKNGTSVL